MFVHPALDLPLLHLSALLERAHPSLTKLLEDTAFVAHDRIRRDAEVRHALMQVDAPPFVGPSRTVYASSPFVTQRDLLVAMLAPEKNGWLEMLYAGAPPNPAGYQELITQAQGHYARMMESKMRGALDPLEAFTRTLELPWSARHALAWRSGHDAPLTADSLVCALEPRAWATLAEYVPDYVEGLVTADEAAAWLVRPYQEGQLPLFGGLYADLHGQWNALHQRLLHSPVVWIQGPVGSGRHALASAWLARIAYGDGRDGPLKGLRCGVAWHHLGSGPEPDAFGPAYQMGLDATVHVLVCPDDGSQHGPASTRIDDITLTGGSGALEKLTPNDLRGMLHATLLRPAAARVLFISTAEERTIVCNAVPEAAKIPVMDIAPLVEQDLLPLWISKLPSIRLPGASLPNVSNMLTAFAAATEPERRERKVDVIEQTLLRGRVSFGDGAERLREILGRVRRGRTLRFLDVQSVERYVGTAERLHALAAFALPWDALIHSATDE